jgi:hypothetical protein
MNDRLHAGASQVLAQASLAPPLEAIAKQGWRLDENGALVLMSAGPLYAAEGTFPNLTSYEAAANLIHVDAELAGRHGLDRPAQLGQALLFARMMIASASSDFGRRCVGIVAVGTRATGITVRLHQSRADESWLVDDLEEYQQEALAVLLPEDS